MNIINLTPHNFYLFNDDNQIIFRLPPCKEPARVKENVIDVTTAKIKAMSGDWIEIPISTVQYTEVYNLPEEEPDTYYVVSHLVTQACPGRKDLLLPYELVRNETGDILGCKGMAVYWRIYD